jgi:hypothetical protein
MRDANNAEVTSNAIMRTAVFQHGELNGLERRAKHYCVNE